MKQKGLSSEAGAGTVVPYTCLCQVIQGGTFSILPTQSYLQPGLGMMADSLQGSLSLSRMKGGDAVRFQMFGGRDLPWADRASVWALLL